MHTLHNHYGVPILYTLLDLSQPSVVRLSLRSAGVGIVGVRSTGVGIAGIRSAGVGRRSREARRRRASLLVLIIAVACSFIIDHNDRAHIQSYSNTALHCHT